MVLFRTKVQCNVEKFCKFLKGSILEREDSILLKISENVITAMLNIHGFGEKFYNHYACHRYTIIKTCKNVYYLNYEITLY